MKIVLDGCLIDFGVYYKAAKAILSGASPYLTKTGIPFNYPPTSLFLLIPFSLFSLFSAQIIWTFFSTFCLGLSIYLSIKVLKLKLKTEGLLLLILLIILAFPVKWTLGMGQINHLILLLLVAAFYFFQKKKESLAGVCLGLAVVFKLIPIFLLVLFLIKRKWKVIFYSLLTILLVNLAVIGAFGGDLVGEYFFRILPSLFETAGKEVYYNQAFSGFIARLTLSHFFRFWLSFAFSAFIFLLCFWLTTKYKKLTSFDYALFMTATLLANGLSWQHHFVWLIFPFLTLFSFLKKQKNISFWLVSLLSYFLVAFNIKNPALFSGRFLSPFILSHVFWGTMILFGLLGKTFSKSAV